MVDERCATGIGNCPLRVPKEAGVGAVVVPPGPTPNTLQGWRQQPSGTYVKGRGCFGFQIDGSSFSEEIIVRAVIST